MDNSDFDSVFDSLVHGNHVVDQHSELLSFDMLSDSSFFSSGPSFLDPSNMEMSSSEPLLFDDFFGSFHSKQSSDVSASDSEAYGSPALLDKGLSLLVPFRDVASRTRAGT